MSYLGTYSSTYFGTYFGATATPVSVTEPSATHAYGVIAGVFGLLLARAPLGGDYASRSALAAMGGSDGLILARTVIGAHSAGRKNRGPISRRLT